MARTRKAYPDFHPDLAIQHARALFAAAEYMKSELTSLHFMAPSSRPLLTIQSSTFRIGLGRGHVILCGLALEVLLKAKLKRAKKLHGDLNGSHNLAKLFSEISPAEQQQAESNYSKYVQLHANKTLETFFNFHSDVFEDWRYVYEPKKDNSSKSTGGDEMYHAFRALDDDALL